LLAADCWRLAALAKTEVIAHETMLSFRIFEVLKKTPRRDILFKKLFFPSGIFSTGHLVKTPDESVQGGTNMIAVEKPRQNQNSMIAPTLLGLVLGGAFLFLIRSSSQQLSASRLKRRGASPGRRKKERDDISARITAEAMSPLSY
jgi:hypothetical protein